MKAWDKKPPNKIVSSKRGQNKPQYDPEMEIGHVMLVPAQLAQCVYCDFWLYDTMNRCGFCDTIQWS